MRQFILSAALFLAGAAVASADYIQIKIDINKMDLVPKAPKQPAGAGQVGGQPMPMPIPPKGGAFLGGQPVPGPAIPGGFGGAAGIMGGQPQPGQPPVAMPPPPEDPNGKWISAFVEVKFHVNEKSKAIDKTPTPLGYYLTYDHKWGKNIWLPNSYLFPLLDSTLPKIEHPTFSMEFARKFNKENNSKARNVDNWLHLARFALSRGQLPEFHKAMAEVEKLNDKHPLYKNYQRLKKDLVKPATAEDPAQQEILNEITKSGYKPTLSKKGRYCVYARSFGNDRNIEASIARRLILMEDTLETFYYWFAVQKEGSLQPNLPKFRLNAIVTSSKEEFTDRHKMWASPPMVADGFTPRRDNIIVMSGKPRLHDPLHLEFEKVLNEKLQEANEKLGQKLAENKIPNFGFTREDLLTGRVKGTPGATIIPVPMYLGAAQTAVLLSKALEDEAERHTTTHETVRQLLIASEMFPRNVQIPEWMIDGLAAFFETAPLGLHPTIASPSWTHLVSFKYLRATQKLDAPHDVLGNLIADAYHLGAAEIAKESQEQRGNKELQKAARDSWEVAHCTAWAFVYYLAQNRKLDYLFSYGKELNKLPRDMDLNDFILQGCFATAFDMVDSTDPRQIDGNKLKSLAGHWFDAMAEVNVEPATLQAFLLQQRARLDGHIEEKSPTDPGPMPDPKKDPNPNQPPPPPPPPPSNLAGTKWAGHETLPTQNTKLHVNLNAGNQVTISGGKLGNASGTWSQSGNKITLKFNGDTVTYTGTVDGNKMHGTATDGNGTWNWTVQHGASPAAQPPNRPPLRPPLRPPVRPPFRPFP